MKTIRRRLRDGELEKDTYERLAYSECGGSLKEKSDPDEVFSVRICADCGRE